MDHDERLDDSGARENGDSSVDYTPPSPPISSGEPLREGEAATEASGDRPARDRAPRGSRGAGWALWLLLLLLVAALVRMNLRSIVADVQYGLLAGRQQAESVQARTRLAKLEDTATAFRLVAQSVGPSVVHIDVRLKRVREDDAASLPWFRQSGQGSGVIVDEEGYILTNHHVIENAERVVVRLGDGRTFRDAGVIGVDPMTDLAVLKIDAENLVAAPWGDSETLEVGDWVLAVGNPFGLDRSVTAGIVSAKGRRNVVNDSGIVYQDFLQTDAAVNPGNSGGPLIDLKGRVVGVTTAIVGQAYQGVSFAIPSQLAHDIYVRLRSEGQVQRGWLGVALVELTHEQAEELEIPRRGVIVTDIVGGPAQEAGVERGDIVLRWNGREVDDPTDLSLQVAATEVGTEAQMEILRDGEELSVAVQVGRRPAE